MKTCHLQNKKWDDLSAVQKSAVVTLGVVEIALLIAALVDIRKRAEDEINGDKRLWTLVSFIDFFGPLAYFIFGRKPLPVSSAPSDPRA